MDSKQDSNLRIDPDGKRLQIDDLIIIPNNLHTPGAAGTEGTGSALQNLAKIASRYQNTSIQPGGLPGFSLPHLASGGVSPSLTDTQGMDTDETGRRKSSSGSDNQSLNMAKKPRLDPSNANMFSGQNLAEMEQKLIASGLSSSQLQQSLLAMFPPNLLAGLPPTNLTGNTSQKGAPNKAIGAGISTQSGGQSTSGGSNTSLSGGLKSDASNVANANNAMQLLAACSMAGIPPIPLPSDLSKLGPDGLNLLQMYEKHLQQIASSITGGSTTASNAIKNGSNPSSTIGGNNSLSTKMNSSTKKENSGQINPSLKYSNQTTGLHSSSNTHSNAKDKDRSKVCKPPPETKRPPSLMQTPCAFKQTTSIYTNPLAELTKAREAAAASSSSSNSRSSSNQLPSIGPSNLALGNSTGGSGQAPLDLTSTPKKPNFTVKSPLSSPKHALGGGMGLNLKKESTLLKPGAIGSSGQENASSSAKNQQALDLAAILQLDPSKLDPATASLHLQLTQQLAANPQLLNPSSSSYLNLASLGLPQASSSLLTSGSSTVKNEMKPSPFSAEALLSKPSPSKLPSLPSASPYSDIQSSVKPNPASLSGKSSYANSVENMTTDRRISNSSPATNVPSNHSSSAKLAAAQANAAALAFGLPLGAASVNPPRQSPSSSALAAASSTSHSPSSSNAERSNRASVSPWHKNLASSGSGAITPNPKLLNSSSTPSSKSMPPLTANPNAAAYALLEKLGLDKLGVDKQTLLKDPTFQSALLNLGIPPSLLGSSSASASAAAWPPQSTSITNPHSSLNSIVSNHSVTPTISGLSHTPSPSTTSSSYGAGTSTTWALSNPAASLSPSAAQSQSLLSNPYLALMSGGPGAAAAASSQYSASAAAHPKSSQANYAAAAALMDPATSAYYAALYSQQMYGAAGLNPYSGLSSGAAPRSAVPPQPIPGLDPLQAATLQSMMGGVRPPSSSYGGSSAAAASAAAMASAMAAAAATNPPASANPFSAYAGLGGLSGFPGLGGFPSARKDH